MGALGGVRRPGARTLLRSDPSWLPLPPRYEGTLAWVGDPVPGTDVHGDHLIISQGAFNKWQQHDDGGLAWAYAHMQCAYQQHLAQRQPAQRRSVPLCVNLMGPNPKHGKCEAVERGWGLWGPPLLPDAWSNPHALRQAATATAPKASHAPSARPA